MSRMHAGLAVALVLVGAGAAARAGASELGNAPGVERTLHAAGVVLDGGRCSGVLAENAQLVLTARHCVGAEGTQVRARFAPGFERTAWVVGLDERADQAVLFLEDPVPIAPLSIARRRMIPGSVLYFEGNPAHPRFQSARLDRIGQCPSLPSLPNALFTGIDGVPGDSGAPLVDGSAHIAGLVHGGARCHIATPADTLARLVDRVLERESPAVAELARRPIARAPGARAAASAPTAPPG